MKTEPDGAALRGILDSLRFPVVSLDLRGRIRFVNAAAAAQLSESCENLAGTSLYEHFAPGPATALRERMRQTIQSRTEQSFEAEITLPEGGAKRFESTYHPQFDGRGDVVGVQIVARELPPRRSQAVSGSGRWGILTDALSISDDRVRAILETAPLLIGILDVAGIIRFVNRVPEEHDVSKVIGSSITDWVTDDYRALVGETLRKAIRTHEVTEYRAQGLTGREWLTRLTPLVHEGEVRQVLVCSLDITEQSRLEAQLQRKQKFESLGTMASGIAHDFSNLLTAILGNADRARALWATGRDPRPHLDNVEAAAQKAGALCQHLLAYAGRDRPLPGTVEVNTAVQHMLCLTRAASSSRIELEPMLAPALPLIRCSEAQLGQIVLNLVNNAVDAIDGHGCIRIATRSLDVGVADERFVAYLPAAPAPGQYVELKVSDTGQGLSPSQMTRMFDPFYTTKSSGHGLGLSTVLGIVASHGAAIGVESELNEGTSVIVLLPVSEA